MASLPDSKYIHARESTDIENEAGPSNSEALRRPSGGLHRGLSARQASMIAIGGAIGTGNAFSALFSESFINRNVQAYSWERDVLLLKEDQLQSSSRIGLSDLSYM